MQKTFEERVRFAEFKFLTNYSHLLDKPVSNDVKKTSNEKKHKKIKAKEKKSKKEKKKDKIQPQQLLSPLGFVVYDASWVKNSFERVFLSLPADKYLDREKERILLNIWLFAEEEEFIRRSFVSSFQSQ